MSITRMGALVAACVVFAACGGGKSNTPKTEVPTKASVTVARPTRATPGLTELDILSPLVVKGRDRLRVCVQVLDNSLPTDDAVASVQQALDVAVLDKRWPKAFDTPLADVGCPLPPVAFQSQEGICRPEVGPYMVYAFVGDESLFIDRFPTNVVSLSGMRKADEELLSSRGGGTVCGHGVAEAWYLTPKDLEDSAILQVYIFDIFTIADICC